MSSRGRSGRSRRTSPSGTPPGRCRARVARPDRPGRRGSRPRLRRRAVVVAVGVERSVAPSPRSGRRRVRPRRCRGGRIGFAGVTRTPRRSSTPSSIPSPSVSRRRVGHGRRSASGEAKPGRYRPGRRRQSRRPCRRDPVPVAVRVEASIRPSPSLSPGHRRRRVRRRRCRRRRVGASPPLGRRCRPSPSASTSSAGSFNPSRRVDLAVVVRVLGRRTLPPSVSFRVGSVVAAVGVGHELRRVGVVAPGAVRPRSVPSRIPSSLSSSRAGLAGVERAVVVAVLGPSRIPSSVSSSSGSLLQIFTSTPSGGRRRHVGILRRAGGALRS